MQSHQDNTNQHSLRGKGMQSHNFCEGLQGGALSTCMYGEVSPIFLNYRILPKVIFLGPNKTETMLIIFFDTKYCYIDISGFDGGNPDFYLHCLVMFYVHVQVYIYV